MIETVAIRAATGAAIGAAASAAAVLALGGLAYATVAPTCAFWGPVVARGSAGSHSIALTFDDGPTAGTTDRVLDILAAANVKAAFFVVGVNARQAPDLLRRIHEEGHLIANHTLDHSHYTVFGRLPYWRRQIQETNAIVESIVGVRPALFRPPMGVRTWHTARATRELGHTVVTWSRRAVDGFPTTSQRILDRLAPAERGEILLLHDGVEPYATHRDRSATIAALRPLIDRFVGRGLSPVRLDELIGVAPYQSREAVAAPAVAAT